MTDPEQVAKTIAAAAPKMLAALKAARPTVANALADANVGTWLRETRETILADIDAAIALADGKRIDPDPWANRPGGPPERGDAFDMPDE